MSSAVPPGINTNPDVEYFQQLADGAPVMIWMSGRDMGCFYFNRAWLEYRGRSLKEEFGNGWAEGVHPEDLDRCVQHYTSSFEKRVPFAMSYRLQRHCGEYRWILDRGAPHYTSDGEFLGFYGGCAEMCTDASVARVKELRRVLPEMREFAEQLAATQSRALQGPQSGGETLRAKALRLQFENQARQHAIAELGKLAADMLTYNHIPNGACLSKSLWAMIIPKSSFEQHGRSKANLAK